MGGRRRRRRGEQVDEAALRIGGLSHPLPHGAVFLLECHVLLHFGHAGVSVGIPVVFGHIGHGLQGFGPGVVRSGDNLLLIGHPGVSPDAVLGDVGLLHGVIVWLPGFAPE